MYRPPARITDGRNLSMQTKQKKKTNKKKTFSEKSGLGPGKRNLARQKTFRHKLLNLVKVWSLIKKWIVSSPRLHKSATGWSSAYSVFDCRVLKWCWYSEVSKTTDMMFFRWRNLRREAELICPTVVKHMQLSSCSRFARMPLLITKIHENRGNFKGTFELC